MVKVKVGGKATSKKKGIGRKSPKRENPAKRGLAIIDGVKLDSSCNYAPKDLGIYGFSDWPGVVSKIDNSDKARAAIYALFQPLFDALVTDGALPEEVREVAFQVYQASEELGARFLTEFYSGNSTLAEFIRGAEEIGENMRGMDGASYRTKYRNVGQFLGARDVASFIKSTLEAADEEVIPSPGLIIGCACGASEFTQPLAGILGVPRAFIRRSKRRNDEQPRIIPQQRDQIAASVDGRDVWVIEDAVCTGGSIRAVMEQAVEFGAKAIVGLAAYSNGGYTSERKRNLKQVRREVKDVEGVSNLYVLK